MYDAYIPHPIGLRVRYFGKAFNTLGCHGALATIVAYRPETPSTRRAYAIRFDAATGPAVEHTTTFFWAHANTLDPLAPDVAYPLVEAGSNLRVRHIGGGGPAPVEANGSFKVARPVHHYAIVRTDYGAAIQGTWVKCAGTSYHFDTYEKALACAQRKQAAGNWPADSYTIIEVREMARVVNTTKKATETIEL